MYHSIAEPATLSLVQGQQATPSRQSTSSILGIWMKSGAQDRHRVMRPGVIPWMMRSLKSSMIKPA